MCMRLTTLLNACVCVCVCVWGGGGGGGGVSICNSTPLLKGPEHVATSL